MVLCDPQPGRAPPQRGHLVDGVDEPLGRASRADRRHVGRAVLAHGGDHRQAGERLVRELEVDLAFGQLGAAVVAGPVGADLAQLADAGLQRRRRDRPVDRAWCRAPGRRPAGAGPRRSSGAAACAGRGWCPRTAPRPARRGSGRRPARTGRRGPGRSCGRRGRRWRWRRPAAPPASSRRGCPRVRAGGGARPGSRGRPAGRGARARSVTARGRPAWTAGSCAPRRGGSAAPPPPCRPPAAPAGDRRGVPARPRGSACRSWRCGRPAPCRAGTRPGRAAPPPAAGGPRPCGR